MPGCPAAEAEIGTLAAIVGPGRETLTSGDKLGARSCSGAKDRKAHTAEALAVAVRAGNPHGRSYFCNM